MATAATEVPKKGYPPGMTHQVFGDDEQILGYTGLKIQILIATDTYVPLLLHKFDKTVSPATNYVGSLTEQFPLGLPTSVEEAHAAAAEAPTLEKALEGCKSVLETATSTGEKVAVLHSNLASASPELQVRTRTDLQTKKPRAAHVMSGCKLQRQYTPSCAPLVDAHK